MKKINTLALAAGLLAAGSVLPVQAQTYASTSWDGVQFIKSYEGLQLYAYLADAAEPYYTIGYGHTGPDVSADMVISQEEADAWLMQDLARHEAYLDQFLIENGITVSQGQYDALASLTYNAGDIWHQYGSFALKDILLNGVWNYSNEEVCAAFMEWNCGESGESLPGLVNRRYQEAAMFLAATPTAGVDEGVTVYHVINPEDGDELYTEDYGEYCGLVNVGWIDDGNGFIAPSQSDKPVYRLYDPASGSHTYTLSSAERDSLCWSGWIYEGIGWFSA